MAEPPKPAERAARTSFAAVQYDAPRRRWGRLIVPFLLLAGGIAAWRTDPQTWRQLQLAAFGGTATTKDSDLGSAPRPPRTDDVAFAGKGEVDVDGGLVKIAPLAYGEVEEVAVKENDRVQVGTVLLRIRNRAAALQIEEARQGVTLAEIEVEKAKRAPADLQKQLEMVDLAVRTEEKLVDIARRNVEQLRSLANQVSEQAVRTSNDALVVAQQRLDAKRLERDRLKLKRPEEDVRAAEAALERVRAKLAAAQEESERYVLRSRASGRVMRVNANVGGTFTPASREPAFLLLPDKPWIVKCEIEQEFAGRVRAGMHAEVRDDATGEKVAEGTVDRVSGVFAPRRQPVEDSRLHNDFRTMECTILLKSNPQNLRIGQHVRALFRTAPPAKPSA